MEVVDLRSDDDDEGEEKGEVDDDEVIIVVNNNGNRRKRSNNNNNGRDEKSDQQQLWSMRAVLPHWTDFRLRELLERAHGNLDRAVDLALAGEEKANKEEMIIARAEWPPVEERQRELSLRTPLTATTDPTTTMPLSLLLSSRSDDSHNIASAAAAAADSIAASIAAAGSSAATAGSTSSEVLFMDDNEDQHPDGDGLLLCAEWHRITQSLAATAADASNKNKNDDDDNKYIWTDPDFPPISQSIDGRKRSGSATTTTSSAAEMIVWCHCGFPATSRTVQSDGPHYGRFYLSCGRPTNNNKRGRPVPPPPARQREPAKKQKQEQQQQQQQGELLQRQELLQQRQQQQDQQQQQQMQLQQHEQQQLLLQPELLHKRHRDQKKKNDNNESSMSEQPKQPPQGLSDDDDDENNNQPQSKKKKQTILVDDHHASTARRTSSAVDIRTTIRNPYAKKNKFISTKEEKPPPAPDSSPPADSSLPKTDHSANKNNSSSNSILSSSPQRGNRCHFFKWDITNGAVNHQYVNNNAASARFIKWRHFGGVSSGCVLYRRRQLSSSSFHAGAVRQGKVGNCWFLSALAVVAERPALMRTIVPHDASLNQHGCYQINLFLNGNWTPVLVDAHLPIFIKASSSSLSRAAPKKKLTRSAPRTAFCDIVDGQLWAPLVEKAYAKAHGSYQQLSGGFIHEALQDLTGAPTETIIFPGGGGVVGGGTMMMMSSEDRDELWARLESFASAGFLMGVATAQGGNGLVGMHAYSVLEVTTLGNCAVGQQAKVTEYFSLGNQQQQREDCHAENGPHQRRRGRAAGAEKTTVRLVRIRNPWGQREWNGAWSAHAEQWTASIRSRLGTTSTYAKGDGTFFISYDDMLQRFHHLDVAKTRAGGTHAVADGAFFNAGGDPLSSSKLAYFFHAPGRTVSATLSLIQPKKRAHTDSSFWYCDPSFILLKRRRNMGGSSWERASCVVSGVMRQSHIDIMVENDTEYCCIPFSCVACLSPSSHYPFRLVLYSCSKIDVATTANHDAFLQEACLGALHQHQLSSHVKLLYPAQPKAVLACIHGTSCVTFIAINGYTDRYFSMKLMVGDLPKGLLITFGREESDLPPQTQAICLVVSTDGRPSAATEFSFRYLSTVTEALAPPTSGSCGAEATHHRRPHLLYRQHQFGSKLKLGVAGDLLATSIEPHSCRASGGDKIDTYLWIPQLGAA